MAIPKRYILGVVLSAVTIVFFQNCGNVHLNSQQQNVISSLKCDQKVYSVLPSWNPSEKTVQFFLHQVSSKTSSEYDGDIRWEINEVEHTERRPALYLGETAACNAQTIVKAKFKNACAETVEKGTAYVDPRCKFPPVCSGPAPADTSVTSACPSGQTGSVTTTTRYICNIGNWTPLTSSISSCVNPPPPLPPPPPVVVQPPAPTPTPPPTPTPTPTPTPPTPTPSPAAPGNGGSFSLNGQKLYKALRNGEYASFDFMVTSTTTIMVSVSTFSRGASGYLPSHDLSISTQPGDFSNSLCTQHIMTIGTLGAAFGANNLGYMCILQKNVRYYANVRINPFDSKCDQYYGDPAYQCEVGVQIQSLN